MSSPDDHLLASQIAYYRAHPPRYDDWWFRRNKHDLGEDARLQWETQVAEVRSALLAFAPLGTVLEIAGGTGNWTAELTTVADSVTVVDASPEAVALARSKVTGNVEWLVTDVFRYQPPQRFDTVFFAFWLSHVPLDRFEQFWDLVAASLTSEGRVFFIDNAHPSLSWHADVDIFRPPDPQSTVVPGIDSVTDLETGVSTRRAADGETYDVVKIWGRADELRDRIASLGWDVRVNTTEWAFLYGDARRR